MSIKGLIAAVILLANLCVASPSAFAVTANAQFGGQIDVSVSSQQQPVGDEYWVGWSLSRCLIGDPSRGSCSVFIGTLNEVVRPKERPEEWSGPAIQYCTRVSVRIDEWLYGNQNSGLDVRLDKVPVHDYSGQVWRDVELKVGSRLLIAFYPPSREEQGSLKRIDTYGLVVGRQNIFPAIREMVEDHRRYTNNPSEILDAPELLHKRMSRVLAAYLVRHFMLFGGGDLSDIDAAVVSQLLGNRYIPEDGWRFLTSPLIRAMTNADYPVSEATRNNVTENVVAAACSDNATLARSALTVLVTLSDGNHINVKPFLDGEHRQKIIKNYRALMTSDPLEKGQTAFESQMGLR